MIWYLIFAAQIFADNEVIIKGWRPSQTLESGPGQVITLLPREESQRDSEKQLSQDSSLSVISKSPAAMNHSIVPSVRGQDLKTTEIYLEDSLLFDPYGFLPLADLKMNSFESVRVFKGVAPLGFVSSSALGIIQYRMPEHFSREMNLFSEVSSSENLSMSVRADSNEFQTRGFVDHSILRNHQHVYDDHGTPYNIDDDQTDAIQSAHQSSSQALLFSRPQLGDHRPSFLAFASEQKGAVPSKSFLSQASQASFRQTSILLSANDDVKLNATTSIQYGVSGIFDKRSLHDRDHQILQITEESKTAVSSQRFHLGLRQQFGQLLIDTQIAYLMSAISQESSLKRNTLSPTLGLGFVFDETTRIETRLSSRHYDKHTVTNRSLAFLWNIFYMQVAAIRRAPSLFEEFGDGRQVRESPDLNPEVTIHREIGVKKTFTHLALYGSLFNDNTNEKIIFIPASAESTKAMNLLKTQTNGIESGLFWGSSHFEEQASYTYLQPINKSLPEQRLIPGIMPHTFSHRLSVRLGPLWSHISSLYQGSYFRDTANEVKLSDQWLHNVAFDLKNISFLVDNLFDQKSQHIESADERTGQTARSDPDGYPLPGRTYRLKLHIGI